MGDEFILDALGSGPLLARDVGKGLDDLLAEVAGDSGVTRGNASGKKGFQKLAGDAVECAGVGKVDFGAEDLCNELLRIFEDGVGAEAGVMGTERRMPGLSRGTAAAACGIAECAAVRSGVRWHVG